jgi:hypothetical protein
MLGFHPFPLLLLVFVPCVADTVKSKIQTNPDHAGRGFVETFLAIYRKEGVRGLYRGWGITAARAAPAHAMIFAVYEYTLKLMSSR